MPETEAASEPDNFKKKRGYQNIYDLFTRGLAARTKYFSQGKDGCEHLKAGD